MFSWFEQRLDAFPKGESKRPPQGLFAFCLYYTKGVWKWLIVMAIFTSLLALIEVSLFGFLGTVVDWLNSNSRETFFQ